MPLKDAVAAQPASPPLISLLSSALVVDTDERWLGGFGYEPETCSTGSTGIVATCDSPSKTITAGDGEVQVEPFVIWAGDACSTFGFGKRDWKGRATRKLIACESDLIENELWTGTLAREQQWDEAAPTGVSQKFLASLDSDVVTDAPATPLDALACLEQALAECNCGGQGMIHATPQLVTYWSQLGTLYREGRTIQTIRGTLVVPGSGYDGSGPPPAAGEAPTPAASGSVWAYATGMVHVRRSPIVVVPDTEAEAMARSTNLLEYRAERIAAVTWDCCHVAAEVDIAPCGIGGAGS